ncbi:MAG: DUF5690 family protein [Saprospiraceae bacterium]|nr:DUF5690 family protein [Saprospiraceae bacterium]
MIRAWLLRTNKTFFAAYAIVAAFGTYFCMYAFRKPFTVATFEDMSLWGIDYKILLIVAQVVGYMLSKFIGIKVIAEMGRNRRALLLLLLIGFAELALFLFAVVPAPYNVLLLFLNGMPLGMIWGIVFSYLEGRTFSEILGAGLSASFIISSGAVKSAGKIVLDDWGFSVFWMPFVTGALFIIPLFFFVYLLEQIPPPSEEDEQMRTARAPMLGKDRKAFFRQFAPGLIMLVFFYMMLTAYRDFRDNFAAELWAALGYGDTPSIFTLSEIPIAIAVLLVLGLTMYISDNRKAFAFYHFLILACAVLVGSSTLLFQQGQLDPALWMILVGLGLYLSYVPFGCILFDRMIAAFRFKGNAGFMIYVADAFGYMGSVGILLYKNFGQANLSWLNFFIYGSYVLAVSGVVVILSSLLYFRTKFNKQEAIPPIAQA